MAALEECPALASLVKKTADSHQGASGIPDVTGVCINFFTYLISDDRALLFASVNNPGPLSKWAYVGTEIAEPCKESKSGQKH